MTLSLSCSPITYLLCQKVLKKKQNKNVTFLSENIGSNTS